jgi:ubiquinol-cytochrome c reductase iron-sulfur subunit
VTDSSAASGEIKRRDFLYIATGAFAAVGVALAAWPFIDEMNPAADVLAAGGPLTVDVSKIEPGQQILVMWRSKPIFIVNRSPAAQAELKSPSLVALLRDPNSQDMQQPSYAQNWSRSLKPEFGVFVGICTHLGCIPMLKSTPGELSPNWPGGYLCPCHGSKYDLAGRVFQDVPAPMNLPVPPYNFASATSLVIGENPPNETFDLGQIQTL